MIYHGDEDFRELVLLNILIDQSVVCLTKGP